MQAQISGHLVVTEAAVSNWKKKLTNDGPQALQMRKATDRPPKFDDAARQALVVHSLAIIAASPKHTFVLISVGRY